MKEMLRGEEQLESNITVYLKPAFMPCFHFALPESDAALRCARCGSVSESCRLNATPLSGCGVAAANRRVHGALPYCRRVVFRRAADLSCPPSRSGTLTTAQKLAFGMMLRGQVALK
jgi:hypothetical protein